MARFWADYNAQGNSMEDARAAERDTAKRRTRSCGPCTNRSRQRQDPIRHRVQYYSTVAISGPGFPDIASVTVQILPAVSCKFSTFVRCRSFCVSKLFFQTCHLRLVLRLFRVLATPITRGRWSSSPLDGFQSSKILALLSLKLMRPE